MSTTEVQQIRSGGTWSSSRPYKEVMAAGSSAANSQVALITGCSTIDCDKQPWAVGGDPAHAESGGICRARKFVVTINWLCRMSRGRKGGPMVLGPDSNAALGKPFDVSRIHAATGNGEREYSRRSPPSL